MTSDRAYLESVQANLYDQLDEADASERPALKAALEAVGERIEEAYEEEGDLETDLAKARREGKAATKASLKRIAAAGGKQALDFALSLPDTMSNEEIERTATRAAKSGALSHQRGTIAALPQARLPSRQAESEWFQKAKAHAESEWARAMGHPMPQRQLTPEDVALAESFNSIAARAAGLTHDPDTGQKIFRTGRPDAEDERLFLAGQASARKIWPGR